MSLLLRFLPYILLTLACGLGLGVWHFSIWEPWGKLAALLLFTSTWVFSLISRFKHQSPFFSWIQWIFLLIGLRCSWYILESLGSFSHPLFAHQFPWLGHESYFSVYLSLCTVSLALGFGVWFLPQTLERLAWHKQNLFNKIIWMFGLLWASFWVTEMILWLCEAWFVHTGKTFLYHHLLDTYHLWFYTGIACILFLFHHLLFQISQFITLPWIWRAVLFFLAPLLWIGIHHYFFDIWPFSAAITLVWILQCSLSLPLSLFQIRLKSYFYLILFVSVIAGMLSGYAAQLHIRQQKIVKEALITAGKEPRQPKEEEKLLAWKLKWDQDSTLQGALEKEFLTADRIATHLQTNYFQASDSLATIQVVDIATLVPPGKPIKPTLYFQDPHYWVLLGKSWWLQYLPGQDPISLSNLWQKAETRFSQGIYSFENYHLAIWDGNQRKIVESKGLFPFQDRTFIEILRANPKAQFTFQGYAVQVIPIQQNRFWILAESRWTRWDMLASFGALFMISIFQILVVFLLLWLVLRSRFIEQIGFSSRIQLFIQVAFLIPLFLLTFIMYRLFDKGLSETQADSQIQVTKNIAQGIQRSFQLWSEGKISQGILEETFQRMSANREQPMSLYDLSGERIAHEGLDLTGGKEPIPTPEEGDWIRQVVRSQFGYRATAVFYPLFTRFNQPMGWLKIDFVDAPLQLDMRKRYLIRSILIMFVVLFGFLCTSAYWMATFLTDPLHVLANRLLGLSLERPNERLPDDMPDEIGTLTKSYNQMLDKLEESKRALAQSEKQAAWQEVAKQVVHEIKNPLTPMKLQVQQMIRQIPENETQEEPLRRKKSLLQLIDKIDHLSDIALSFTQFAELEVPQAIRFDLRQWLNQWVPTSGKQSLVQLRQEPDNSPLWVRQDPVFLEKIMHQIINFYERDKPHQSPISVQLEVTPYVANVVMFHPDVVLTEAEQETLFLPKITEHTTQFGLAMAKKGMESSGGNLWFGRLNGQTQAFFIEIPLG